MHTNKTRIFCTAILCLFVSCGNSAPHTTARAPQCKAAVTGRLPDEIHEASGIAFSRRNPGVMWVHNDDAPGILFGVDSTGNVLGRVGVRDLKEVDWEDIAVAPCGSGSCVFIADIGDNRHERSKRTIYRVPEPLVSDSLTETPTPIEFDMGDRADDAESLFVHENKLYIITKGRRGPITLYRVPDMQPLARLTEGLVQLPDMVTAASASPDGKYVAIRTYSNLQIYTFDNEKLTPVLDSAFDLQPLGEFQGEGLDMRDDGVLFLVSEKGLSEEKPPLSRVQCSLK